MQTVVIGAWLRRHWSPLLAATAIIAVLAGCSTSRSESESTLDRYYNQELEWEPCEADSLSPQSRAHAECATLRVPMSYSDPDEGTIDLAVSRLPATKQPARLGSLVVNPGGPGAEGLMFVDSVHSVLAHSRLPRRDTVSATYDLVGFDPRGVGDSQAIHCLPPQQLRQFLTQDIPDHDHEAVHKFAAEQRDFITACSDASGPLLANLSTADTARDLDLLRSALGDERLNYFGVSYGTTIGATYLTLFPDTTGRLVLDSAVGPDLTGPELVAEQARSLDDAFRRFLADCPRHSDCPLVDNPQRAYDTVVDVLNDLHASPRPVAARQELNQYVAALAIAGDLYSPSTGWPQLRTNLRALLAGNPRPLYQAGVAFTMVVNPGAYLATTCLDYPADSDPADAPALANSLRDEVGGFAAAFGWGALPCSLWPHRADGLPDLTKTQLAEPPLVIGTTTDPATPYRWSQDLAEAIPGATLLTLEGDGHGATFIDQTGCVIRWVTAYLLDGNPPPRASECPTSTIPN